MPAVERGSAKFRCCPPRRGWGVLGASRVVSAISMRSSRLLTSFGEPLPERCWLRSRVRSLRRLRTSDSSLAMWELTSVSMADLARSILAPERSRSSWRFCAVVSHPTILRHPVVGTDTPTRNVHNAAHNGCLRHSVVRRVVQHSRHGQGERQQADRLLPGLHRPADRPARKLRTAPLPALHSITSGK